MTLLVWLINILMFAICSSFISFTAYMLFPIELAHLSLLKLWLFGAMVLSGILIARKLITDYL